MRIIAGTYRGRNLKSPRTLEIRPTSDRLRETLFNVIAPRVGGARFLDLCAGSGAVGIEALSRGAAHSTFVDSSREMKALIEANLDLCRIPEERWKVVRAEAVNFLHKAISTQFEPWNIAFFDPPYADNYLDMLQLFGRDSKALLGHQGLLIVEHRHKNQLPEVVAEIKRARILKQGDSALSFYEKASS